ncbi:MAG: SCO family protein [Opitutae bacterium]|nr:SCO family protein [Opitutae bacterium]
MKTKFPFLALLAAAFAFADEPAKKPDACCEAAAVKAIEKKDACCEAVAASPIENLRPATAGTNTGPAAAGNGVESKIENSPAAYSRESLYQLDGQFVTDAGQPFSLGELRGRPVVLTMFFASCGYACPLIVTDMLAIQGRLPAELRDKAVFVLVSFDTARDTPAVLAQYRMSRNLNAHWVLLHGEDAPVRELAALVGVKYKQEADGMFAHSNLVTILDAAGEIVHQRAGLKGGLDEAADALATVLRK